MGLKPSDFRAVPLSADLHAMQHRVGERSFWEMHGRDPEVVIIAHLLAYIDDHKLVITVLERAANEKE